MEAFTTTKTITVTMYRAFDGTKWNTPEDALSHEKQFCEDLYKKMEQGATYPEDEIKLLPFPTEQMNDIYKDFSHEVYETLVPDAPDIDWQQIYNSRRAQVFYESDMNALLIDHSAEELFGLMTPILEKYGLHKIYFYRLSDIPRGIAAAKIRNGWETALRNAKDVRELNRALWWSFSDKDIAVLAQLHKSNKFRKKIENMLEDANFHQECDDFIEKRYDQYLAKSKGGENE